MKAVTVWQPWASLLAIGAKNYETRGWATSYRGPIAIHAAGKPVHESLTGLLLGAEAYTAVIAALAGYYRQGHPSDLPTGAIIATAELVNVWSIVYHPGSDIDKAQHIRVGGELNVDKHHPDFGRIIVPTAQELIFGDWTPGRFAWEMQNVQMLDKPIPAKGRQGLWNLEAT